MEKVGIGEPTPTPQHQGMEMLGTPSWTSVEAVITSCGLQVFHTHHDPAEVQALEPKRFLSLLCLSAGPSPILLGGSLTLRFNCFKNGL